MGEETFSVKTVAGILKRTAPSIRRAIREKRIIAVKVLGTYEIAKSELERIKREGTTQRRAI